MKEKIKAELQKKHAGQLKKLSPKALELLLDKYAAKVTTEDEIEDFVDGLDNQIIPFSDFVELIQKESDRRTREARTNLEKEFDLTPKKKAEGQETKENGQEGSEEQMPAWMKGFMSKFESFEQKLKQTESEKILSTFKSAAKAKGIPDDLIDLYPVTGDDFKVEDAVSALSEKWTKLQQVNANANVGDGRVAVGAQGVGKVNNDVLAFTKKQVEAQKNK